VTGGLLAVVLALAFMWLQLRADHVLAVLATARPVAAGQVIASADLKIANVAPDPRVRLVTAAQASSIVGRTAAVPLVAGALLSPDQIGPSAWPEPGEAVVALPVKPGRIPAGTAPGARVQVLAIRTDAASPISPGGTPATVVQVAGDLDLSGTVVVSLLIDASEAAAVAAAGGEATLVLTGPGR
jgi:hypothetical protein